MIAAAQALTRLQKELVALAEASPLTEVCGFVLEHPGQGNVELRTAHNEAEDPARRFMISPQAVMRVLRQADLGGPLLRAVYHSHPEGGADLSARDLAELVVDGEPLLPGVELWVVALAGGIATEVRVFSWVKGGYLARVRRRGPFTLREVHGRGYPRR